MPELPLSERIARNLVDTVKGINTAAGYHNTVSAVERRKQFGRHSGDRLIVLFQGDAERDETVEPTTNTAPVQWKHPFAFDCYVVEPEGGAPVDLRINTIRADVEKAVMVDPHRGGLAIDTAVGDPQIFTDEEGGQIAGVTVTVVVKYRTRLNDPNTQA